VVVPGSELGGSGVFSLSVSEVSFRAANSDSVSFGEFSVFLGTASGKELVGAFDDNIRGERTQVFCGSNVTFAPSEGWIRIPLDLEYMWNGSDSIVLEVVYHGADSGMLYCGYFETDGFRTMYSGNDEARTGSLERFAPHLLVSGVVRFESVFGAVTL
jgi:hypothetical protein